MEAVDTRSPSLLRDGNIIKLAVAHALGGANSAIVFATAAIVGNSLSPDPSLATLPITVFVVGMAMSTIPMGSIAHRYGRHVAFMWGTGAGIAAGLLAASAVIAEIFWLFCVSMLLAGMYAAVVLTFRFAAADCVPEHHRARALSFVLAGGVFSGVLGPQMVTLTMDFWEPYRFAASFVGQALVAAAAALVLMRVELPKVIIQRSATGRSLTELLRQSNLLTAIVCAVVAYTLMNFIMTAAPLAMNLSGHSQASSNLGMQWHIIAMYAPSFFTGVLIERFGPLRIVTLGMTLIAAAAAVGLCGDSVAHYWSTLILLGVGWNFGFVGASSLVLTTHRPEETTRVQSINDFAVFGCMALGSFLSGNLLATQGWSMVLTLSFVPLVVAFMVLAVAIRTQYLKTAA